VNVRCPNCSAVFPVAPGIAGQRQTAECPLCLLHFEVNTEHTTTPPRGPERSTGAATPSTSDDEFEAFGTPSASHTQVVGNRSPLTRVDGGALGSPRGTGRTESIHPKKSHDSVRIGARPDHVSDLHEIDFTDGDAAIDFDALLSDAVLAVEKPAARPSYERVSSPRSGGGVSEESILPVTAARPGPRPAPESVLSDAEADSLFEERGASSRSFDTEFTVANPAVAAPPAEVVRRLGSQARRNKPKPSGAGKTLVLVGLVTLGAGAGLDVAGYGLFGSKLWLGEQAAQTGHAAGPTAAKLLRPIALDDMPASYVAEIRRLDALSASRPQDAEVQRTLAERLLDLLERHPDVLQDDPPLKAKLNALVTTQPALQTRKVVLDALAAGQSDVTAAQLATLDQGAPDDRAVAARVRLFQFKRRVEKAALANPGLTVAPEADPLRTAAAGDAGLEQAAVQIAALRPQMAKAPHRIKFSMLDAELRDRRGELAAVTTGAATDRPTQVDLLQDVTRTAPDHLEARLLLASAHLELSHLTLAEVIVQDAARLAADKKQPRWRKEAAQLTARLAARRGDKSGVIKALQASLEVASPDELTTIRLARLLQAERRLDEAHAILQTGKKAHGYKSVAFEVALVEYWLAVNRNEDALLEIGEATRLHPTSVDLLFLRGQIEEKENRSATARDSFAQVVAREPRHLRAIVRLAELQAAAGRHDEALATLQKARQDLGDDETVLRLMAEELAQLRREDEARVLLARLLQMQPDNRVYLLRAAQMDLRAGQIEQALVLLGKLRTLRALDREAAIQMAKALGGKNQAGEAAATLMPFAEANPTDVELNTLAGKYLIEDKDYDRAQTVLKRAAGVASGKNAETMFQFGRLAFRLGEIEAGITRTRQAIAADPMAHAYRYELARTLFDNKSYEGARDIAIRELQSLLGNADAYAAAGRPLADLAGAHRMMARHFSELHRYPQAVPHLRAILRIQPDDADSLLLLGRALYHTGSPDAADVLRRVVRLRPGEREAALFLGLSALRKGQSSDALQWLQRAAGSGAELAEAWYHIAMIYKDRGQDIAAKRALEQFLRSAAPGDPYRADADRALKVLR